MKNKIIKSLLIIITFVLAFSIDRVNAATDGVPVKMNSFELNGTYVYYNEIINYSMDLTKETGDYVIDSIDFVLDKIGTNERVKVTSYDMKTIGLARYNLPCGSYKVYMILIHAHNSANPEVSTVHVAYVSDKDELTNDLKNSLNISSYNGVYSYDFTKSLVIVRPSVTYTTHVQDIGWQSYVKDGAMAGTSHQSKRLEGIKIKLEGAQYEGNIEYRTHIQDIGWEKDFKKNDEMSGSSHQSKRLEAIEIKLTGELAEHYDVYYRVHAQDAGWMAWAKNGEQAGTSGYSRRLEGIEIVLVEKGDNPPTRTDTRTNKAFVKKQITYATHVQDYGWQDGVSDGKMSGTSHQSKRLEGIVIVLNKPEVSGNVEYRTHIQDIGWEKDFKKNGEMSGTSHQSKRLEAIEIKLTGEMAEKYDIYYRVHAQEFGWMGWAKNGESAGTAHYSYRLEAIEIVLVEKGENPPERTDTKTTKSFVDRKA